MVLNEAGPAATATHRWRINGAPPRRRDDAPALRVLSPPCRESLPACSPGSIAKRRHRRRGEWAAIGLATSPKRRVRRHRAAAVGAGRRRAVSVYLCWGPPLDEPKQSAAVGCLSCGQGPATGQHRPPRTGRLRSQVEIADIVTT